MIVIHTYCLDKTLKLTWTVYISLFEWHSWVDAWKNIDKNYNYVQFSGFSKNTSIISNNIHGINDVSIRVIKTCTIIKVETWFFYLIIIIEIKVQENRNKVEPKFTTPKETTSYVGS